MAFGILKFIFSGSYVCTAGFQKRPFLVSGPVNLASQSPRLCSFCQYKIPGNCNCREILAYVVATPFSLCKAEKGKGQYFSSQSKQRVIEINTERTSDEQQAFFCFLSLSVTPKCLARNNTARKPLQFISVCKYGTFYLNSHVTLSRVYIYLSFGLFCASCLNHCRIHA